MKLSERRFPLEAFAARYALCATWSAIWTWWPFIAHHSRDSWRWLPMHTQAEGNDVLLPNMDGWSEADVREEIIAPVLSRLGYKTGTTNNVLREKAISLRYPYMFLGRKRPGKDVVLRGRPDYICEARGVTRWAIEAKPPSQEITVDDIEQAHSYAVHPELAAPLFVITNGRRWLIFESLRGPAAEPVRDCSQVDLLAKPHLLSSILSPTALARRYPVREFDTRKPLIEGFGSRVPIVGGFTRYDAVDAIIEGMPAGFPAPDLTNPKRLEGYSFAIVGDQCFRNDDEGIVAEVRMHFPNDTLREFAERIGMVQNRYIARDDSISTDADAPTIFECSAQVLVPAGTRGFDITQWATVATPVPVRVTWYAEAIGSLTADTFHGVYSARMLIQPQVPTLEIESWVFMRGAYEVKLGSQ